MCHSDIHIRDAYFDLGGGRRLTPEQFGSKLPMTMGHEIAGTVVAFGPPASGAGIGTKVVVYPWIGCGACEACLEERDTDARIVFDTRTADTPAALKLAAGGPIRDIIDFVTKQAFGIWSREPGASLFTWSDLTQTVAAQAQTKLVLEAYEGPGVVAGYTVLSDRRAAPKGIVVADIDGVRRTIGVTHDASLVAALQAKEFCGAAVRLFADGTFQIPD